MPLDVSRQTSVSFSFTATNNGGADLVLIPDSTRFWFDGQSFDAPLVGETTIPGAGSETLTFQSTLVSSDASPSYIPRVRVVGMDNGFKREFMLTAQSIEVLEATDVAIASTTTSQDTITNNQSASFTVTLNVENRGGADIRLDDTDIEFIRAGVNQSGRFIFTPPGVFDSGSDTLAGGTNGSITFDVVVNGSSLPLAGAYTIEGFLDATNLVNNDPISVDTSTGGMGALFVELPGVLEIVGITPGRPTVTEGQTSWQIRMVVRNSGEAALDLLLPGSASVAFDPADAGWNATPRNALQGGGVQLEENELDTLVFDVTDTGAPDTYTISGQVTAEDANSPDDEQTVGPVSGDEVTVQTPGDIRITSVTPSQDPVTKFQENDWTISVGVTNDGGAEVQLSNDPARTYIEFANGIPARVTGPVGSLLLAGGASTILTFTIPQTQDFSDGFGNQPFTAHIEGTELNQSTPVTPAEQAGSVEVQLEPNPTYIAGTLLPKNVNAGEPATFRIDVSQIVGAATLVLDADRTKFSFTDGVTTIQPRLDASQVGAILAGTDTTLSFEEVPIPSTFTEGVYPVTVDIVGTENGNNYSKSFTLAGDRVTIGAESAVVIVDMLASQDSVTAGQLRDWQVRMIVRNDGAAALQLKPDLTKLSISVSGAGNVTTEYTIPDVAVFQISGDDSLRSGAVDTLVFNVESTGTTTGPSGALRIDGTFVGYDIDGDKDVSDNTSNDGWIDMLIQTPADLNVAASVTFPPDATTLSTEQPFTLTALVTNNGQSLVDNSGTLTLTVPVGFTIDAGSPATQTFVVGAPVQWDIRAPELPATNQVLEVDITNSPIERNSGDVAVVTTGTAPVTLEIVEQAGFTPLVFEVISPDGAMDDSVSTDQRYTIQARTLAEATTTDITATLEVLSGSVGQVIDPSVRSLGDGDGGEKAVQWRIDAPATPGEVSFLVTYDGFDQNSSENIEAFSDTLSVTTVTKARLEYTASITSPDEAKDGRVAFGTVFDIEARVDNLGLAAVDTAGARLRIELPDLDPEFEYTIVSGDALQPFVVGQTVTWQVRAPIRFTSLELIRVVMDSIPNDENTGSAAVVSSSPVPIAIQTESNAVTVDDFSSDIGIEAMVVPKGTSDIDMLAVEVANLDDSAERVRIDTFRVTVLDKNGREVDEPSRTLSEFYVYRRGDPASQIDGVITQNPMIIDAGGIILEQADADSFVFAVSIADNAQLDEIVLSFHGPFSIAVKEDDSGRPIAVVDKDTGQLINGRIRSQPLVILSNEFEEYAHNYPNPFQAGSELTRIAYIMDSAGPVSIRVYDLRGSLVYEQQFSQGEPGTGEGPQEVTWDGRNMKGEVVRNGMYICQLDAGSKSTRIKMAVAK